LAQFTFGALLSRLGRASSELGSALGLSSVDPKESNQRKDQVPGTAPTQAIPALVPETDFWESLRA